MPRFRFIFSMMIALCGHQLLAQKHMERFDLLDVQHYKFAIELNDTTDVFAVEAELTILFKQDAQAFDLDLVAYDDWDGKGMKVTSVIHKKKAQKFEQEEERLTIALKKRVWKGEEHHFRIIYSGTTEEGLITTRNKFGDRVFFGENWPNRAKNWLPTVDHPSDKATVEFIIKAPAHYQVIANGERIMEERTERYVLSHWMEKVPLPPKVMVIGVAPFSIDSVGYVNDIPVTTWVFPQNEKDGFYDFSPGLEILDYFIDKFGAYPYSKLANVQSKTRFGGMENASNIFYFENSVNGKRERNYLIAHEIAHQWFGNSATEADWHHIWLSEGFATYFTNVYAEDTFGKEVLAERMRTQRTRVVNYAKENFAPVVDTSVEEYDELLNANSYQKGSWVLHMLRRQLGDETFFKGIRTYYEQYGGKIALTSDLIRVMEIVSGKDLDAFFQQWIFQPGHPVIDFDWQYTAESGELVVEMGQQQEGHFTFNLDIGVSLADGTRSDHRLSVTEKNQSFRVSVPAEVKEVVIDPNTWLLHELAEE